MKSLTTELISLGGLHTPRIINAFDSIDRADFVPDSLLEHAYVNAPLPIGGGQTISQPYTVAFMLELLQPQPGQRILDIGFGSGWQTTLLAHIVGEKGRVYAVEVVPELFEYGKTNIEKYGFISRGIVTVYNQDASNGSPEHAPLDRIIAAAAAEKLPQAWLEQLVPDGILVAPVQHSIWRIRKDEKGNITREEYPGFAFVPLVAPI